MFFAKEELKYRMQEKGYGLCSKSVQGGNPLIECDLGLGLEVPGF